MVYIQLDWIEFGLFPPSVSVRSRHDLNDRFEFGVASQSKSSQQPPHSEWNKQADWQNKSVCQPNYNKIINFAVYIECRIHSGIQAVFNKQITLKRTINQLPFPITNIARLRWTLQRSWAKAEQMDSACSVLVACFHSAGTLFQCLQTKHYCSSIRFPPLIMEMIASGHSFYIFLYVPSSIYQSIFNWCWKFKRVSAGKDWRLQGENLCSELTQRNINSNIAKHAMLSNNIKSWLSKQ